jgi:hypothetical protein
MAPAELPLRLRFPSPPRFIPSLPPEIWIRILSYHSDLTHLWTTCRLVSPAFRDFTEQVFAEYHLRNTYVDFQLEKYNLGGKTKRPEIPTTFSHFSQDVVKRMAWFSDTRDIQDVVGAVVGANPSRKGKGKLNLEYKSVMDRWEENVKNLKPELPYYTIRVSDMVNDTALPGLELDREGRRVSFNWRGMYRAFFKEEARLRERRKTWEAEVATKLEEQRIKRCKGEKISVDDVPKIWTIAKIVFKKQIRRARLKEFYDDNDEKSWVIDSLKHFDRNPDGKALIPLAEIPGAALGERWSGSTYLLETMWIDEWSSLHRIDNKLEQVYSEMMGR